HHRICTAWLSAISRDIHSWLSIQQLGSLPTSSCRLHLRYLDRPALKSHQSNPHLIGIRRLVSSPHQTTRLSPHKREKMCRQIYLCFHDCPCELQYRLEECQYGRSDPRCQAVQTSLK
ncbi:hypothetical protein F5X97DRAFT_188394, partial [Nemania serpens]